MLYKLFIFLCVLLPFQIALNPTEGIDLASIRIFILLLFFLCLAEGLKDRKIKIPHNIQTGLVFSFLALSGLSFFAAKNSDWSLRKLMFLFSIFPIYFIATYLIENKEKTIAVIKGLVLGGTLVALLGIIQFFSQFSFGLERVYNFWAKYLVVPFLGKTFSQAVLQNPSWLVNISGKTYLRATATFPDPHMFSFFLGVVMSLALALFLAERKKGLLGISLSLLLVCDLLTFSRGGYLGIIGGLIFLVIFFWGKISLKTKLIFAVSCILVGFLLIIPNPISERYVSIFNLQEGSNKGRIEIWQKTLEIIEARPWLGVGIGNYPLEIKPTATYREPYYAHNTYLDVAAETGIINALVWVGLLGFSWWAFVKKAKKEILFLGPALGIVLFAVHSLVETAIYSPTVLALFLIMLSFNNIKSDELKRD
jgi:O-antigen ligase